MKKQTTRDSGKGPRKSLKPVLTFMAGILAGGLLVCFGGPSSSLAGFQAPADLLYLLNNGGYKGEFTQYYRIKDEYLSLYEIVSAGPSSDDATIQVVIKAR